MHRERDENHMKHILVIIALLIVTNSLRAQQKKILFDATKAETAGNADWVIDEDNGTPGILPTPAQSTVTASTAENYWTGGLSSWGIALVKEGYYVETLVPASGITYGTNGAQDLSKYDVFIVCEPNTQFTQSERTALVNYVKNGGGLLIISDHAGADRNSDGWDAVHVWNDLFRNNGVAAYPFGFKIDSVDVSETSTNVLANAGGDSVLNGTSGSVSQLKYSNGATITLMPSYNSSVQGLIWRNNNAQGATQVMAARAFYGKGKVFVCGDSSPADDGTGASGNTLYPGWTEVNGNHARMFMNATKWLAVKGTSGVSRKIHPSKDFHINGNYPNPFNPSTKISYSIGSSANVNISIYDFTGKLIQSMNFHHNSPGSFEQIFTAASCASGVYLARVTIQPDQGDEIVSTLKLTLLK
ncbi:MAG: T9SS type A sorting domain-containing protein [Ignavibacteria bacterium]|nr:T9SS type A sorting domain-containing protein [Ignavibacteria bacterium]